MLSINPIGAAGKAGGVADYYEALAREDYYEAGGEPPGRWLGGLASEMGLAGNVAAGQLKAMFEGFHPGTGEALAKNAGAEHKGGWDLSFSAPKSVSTAWAVADVDTRAAIQQAQDRAVKSALAFLEEHAFSTRDRQCNAELNKVLAASYEHSTSREQDPQLHTHLLVANLGQRIDGTFGAIDFDTRWKMSAGAVYRAELAAEMQKLGFAVQAESDSFKLAGVPDDLCDEFSKRRAQIVEALAEKGYTSAKAAEIAALNTREAKAAVSRETLFADWKETALQHGFTAESVNALRQAEELYIPATPASTDEAEAALDPLSREALFAKLTENDSAFTAHKVYQAVAVAAQGRLTAEQIEAHVQDFLKDGELVRLKRREPEEEIKDKRNPRSSERHYSTREMLALEAAMANRAKVLAGTASHAVEAPAVAAAVESYEAGKGFQLSDEQRTAVEYITVGTGQLAVVRGAAGSGKTTFMEPAKAAWEAAGFNVRGCALAGKAAAGMEAVGIKSQTLHSLLHELDGGWEARRQKLQENADKAGAAVAETLARAATIDETHRHKFMPSEKLLDWRATADAELAEHQARQVTAKDVILVDEAGMIGSRQMARLLEHAEQTGFKVVLVGDEKQLQAVAAGGAFAAIQKQTGHVSLIENRRQWDEADRAAASAVVDGRAADAIKSYIDRNRVHVEADQKAAASQMVADWAESPVHVSEKLMLAKTRVEVHLLNDLARAQMKAEGKLGNEVAIGCAAGQRAFADGDRVLFTKNDRTLGVKNGHLGTIEKVDFDPKGNVRLSIRMDHDGSRVEITPEAVQDKQKEPYNHLEHGYAVTTHKAQGVTVNKAFVLGLGDREMGYVQMTRHRDEANIYISAKEIDKLEDEAASVEATPGMLEFVDSLVEKRNKLIEDQKQFGPPAARPLDKPATTDFVTVRKWLDIHSPKKLGLEAKPEEPEDMRRLKSVVDALQLSHQKVTTLDFVQEPELVATPVPEQTQQQIEAEAEAAAEDAYQAAVDRAEAADEATEAAAAVKATEAAAALTPPLVSVNHPEEMELAP